MSPRAMASMTDVGKEVQNNVPGVRLVPRHRGDRGGVLANRQQEAGAGLEPVDQREAENSAMVVAISKYTIAFRPIRPIAFRSPVPAMPTTSVAKISGAMIILIMRRNTSASGLIVRAKSGHR